MLLSSDWELVDVSLRGSLWEINLSTRVGSVLRTPFFN